MSDDIKAKIAEYERTHDLSKHVQALYHPWSCEEGCEGCIREDERRKVIAEVVALGEKMSKALIDEAANDSVNPWSHLHRARGVDALVAAVRSMGMVSLMGPKSSKASPELDPVCHGCDLLTSGMQHDETCPVVTGVRPVCCHGTAGCTGMGDKHWCGR